MLLLNSAGKLEPCVAGERIALAVSRETMMRRTRIIEPEFLGYL